VKATKEEVSVADEIKKDGFSRRGFLQGSATLCAGLALTNMRLFGLSGTTVLSDDFKFTPTVDITSPRELNYNVCPRNCHDTCSLIVEKSTGGSSGLSVIPRTPSQQARLA